VINKVLTSPLKVIKGHTRLDLCIGDADVYGELFVHDAFFAA